MVNLIGFTIAYETIFSILVAMWAVHHRKTSKLYESPFYDPINYINLFWQVYFCILLTIVQRSGQKQFISHTIKCNNRFNGAQWRFLLLKLFNHADSVFFCFVCFVIVIVSSVIVASKNDVPNDVIDNAGMYVDNNRSDEMSTVYFIAVGIRSQ